MSKTEILKKCFGFMDLTTLKPEDTQASVKALVDKVSEYHSLYPDYPLPASICVYPNFAHVVKEHRLSPELHVTTVAGCFRNIAFTRLVKGAVRRGIYPA